MRLWLNMHDGLLTAECCYDPSQVMQQAASCVMSECMTCRLDIVILMALSFTS